MDFLKLQLFEYLPPFGTGLALSFSLILAIGAQNAFVLRQGLLKTHVFAIALFCAVSDALLISLGIGGAALFIEEFAKKYEAYLFGFAALWLLAYGLLRLRDAKRGNYLQNGDSAKEQSLFATLIVAASLTFLNPHVYLDTVLLIGTISLKFADAQRFAFGVGAVSASFVFFFALAYGARALAPLMQKPNAWRILDVIIACIMFALAASMLKAGGML